MPTPNWALAIAIVLAAPSALSLEAASKCIPIEVEVQGLGGAACSPGNEWFDAGLRSAIRESSHAILTKIGGTGRLENRFCFASEMPRARPVRARISMKLDASIIGASNEGGHFVVHTAVPFRAIRLNPARHRRTSFWAADQVTSSCEAMGRAVGMCVVEALYRETGDLKRDQSLTMGPGIFRDPRHVEASSETMRGLVDQTQEALPTIVLWTIVFALAFLAVVVGRALRSRQPG